jgi:hypothetical protein
VLDEKRSRARLGQVHFLDFRLRTWGDNDAHGGGWAPYRPVEWKGKSDVEDRAGLRRRPVLRSASDSAA